MNAFDSALLMTAPMERIASDPEVYGKFDVEAIRKAVKAGESAEAIGYKINSEIIPVILKKFQPEFITIASAERGISPEQYEKMLTPSMLHEDANKLLNNRFFVTCLQSAVMRNSTKSST